jgi:ribose transport system ATP-binding protein
LEIEHLSKSFPGQMALDNVDLAVGTGQIHGLAGHNGSGKSTLVKILSGYHAADPGSSIRVGGIPLEASNPGASKQAGLRFVHQDLGLVDSLSVAENIGLTAGYRKRAGCIDWSAENSRASQSLRDLGHDLEGDKIVGELSPSQRTAVAIARSLAASGSAARILVLDEATARMPAAEVNRLFPVLTKLRAAGISVLFVSHYVDEILRICDYLTVLRDGKKVGTFDAGQLDHSSVVRLIVGSDLAAGAKRTEADAPGTGSPVLVAKGLRGHVIEDLGLAVSPGQILGISGLTGSGREEAAAMLFGGKPRGGTVTVDGHLIPPESPRRSIAAGMALLPADRARNAVVPTMTMRENLTLPLLSPLTRLGLINPRKERQDAATWLGRLGVRPAAPEGSALALSGGNQQRLVLAKSLRLKPKVLVLDEPTQGIDVGAREEIYSLVTSSAMTGTAVVACSSDSDELAAICSEVVVLNRGKIAGRLKGQELTPAAIQALELGPAKEAS